MNGGTSLEGSQEWFRVRFRVLRLKPKLVIIYRRLALVGPGDERFTIDRCIEARRIDNGVSSFAENGGQALRITDLDVLELKHPAARSMLMQELAKMAGQATGYSKYGLGMGALGYGNGAAAREA